MPGTRFQIGQHIRDHVLPTGISVTAAARRLGVGRPALSNLLNGRASLSERMALRLERAFGADGEGLLELQRSQGPVRHERERDVAVRSYVPSFLTVKARGIELWADRIAARTQLAVLLRKLVRETGRDLTRVDFPGFDNSQRPGWDGVVEADTATAWIPTGLSCWEFSTKKDARSKAESDYASRLSLPPEERACCTFVFVTPRNWQAKAEWAKAKEAAGDGWKAVRAYDASDLEQWLEDAIVTPVWFTEQCLESPVEGITTLEHYWRDWSRVSKPPMSRRIFEPNVRTSLSAFKRWLDAPPDQPFAVASDSIGETLAFVTCLFHAAQDAEKQSDSLRWQAKRDMAAVFESSAALRRLAESSQPFIPIAGNAEVEEVLAPLCSRLHCIVPTPRNVGSPNPNVALELLGLSAFHESLDDMGVPEEKRPQLERESGRSPTILRRRLSNIPSIRAPAWSVDGEQAQKLIPLALVGNWRADREADREVLSALAGVEYDEVESQVAEALLLDDAPLWSIDQHRGVVSKVDVLFTVAPRLTSENIEDFLDLAQRVLSETDPALGLPEGRRWMAAVYNKVRDHSDELREGLRETLVMLSVFGDYLFQQRLGISPTVKVRDLIQGLLDPLTPDSLESQEGDLPAYAEAAPETLLRLLERDLAGEDPVTLRLMRPATTAPFEMCPRIGLLWALECIAWNPEYLARTCAILARLARVPIEDNWANTPMASLTGVLSSWAPQTAASATERISLLGMLVDRFPEVAWRMCVGEIRHGMRISMNAYRPTWNGDAAGKGGVVTPAELDAFVCEVWRVLMSWTHNASTLADLVEHMRDQPEEKQYAIWDLIDRWLETKPGDKDRSALRERVRRHCLTRRGRRGHPDALAQRASKAFDRLRPTDVVDRHGWLFANGWVDESWDEMVEDSDDWQGREARIDAQRRAAMNEVWYARGLEGVLYLAEGGNAPEVVGRYLGLCDGMDDETTTGILLTCIQNGTRDELNQDAFMRGLISSAADPAGSNLLQVMGTQLGSQETERLFRCAPFHAPTWRLLDRLPEQVRQGYWQRVVPFGWQHDEEECSEIIDCLLESKRPRAAFAAMRFQLKEVDPSQLARLLGMLTTGSEDRADDHRVDAHSLSDAFQVMHSSRTVPRERLAALEFAFIQALEGSEHGIPNLEEMLSNHPEVFVEAIVRCYRRRDGGEDPDSWSTEDAGAEALASASRRLLRCLKVIPGTHGNGGIDAQRLVQWIDEARRRCAEMDRREVGDIQIGELLSHAPKDDDGSWPCIPVCEAIETTSSDDVARGFIIGKRNARGVVSGDIGSQDQALADRFREWSRRRRTRFPFVGDILLRLARSYESDAKMWDRQADVDKRLGR